MKTVKWARQRIHVKMWMGRKTSLVFLQLHSPIILFVAIVSIPNKIVRKDKSTVSFAKQTRKSVTVSTYRTKNITLWCAEKGEISGDNAKLKK